MEDAQIIAALFDREEAAITAISRTYGSYCTAVARRILTSSEDVEEVLNDTWLRVWNSIPPHTPGNLKLYLARITRNLSCDRFRSQSREKRGSGNTVLALEELSECLPASGHPGEHLEAEVLQLEINRFLSGLPERDRQVFLLRYFYIEPLDAIAKRYCIRQTLVRTILSRTRKKLKQHLEQEGFFE